MKISEFITALENNEYNHTFDELYGKENEIIEKQKKRYRDAAEKFMELYPDCNEISVFSAPGRTEVGGNHTDHQHGCVLAAAVNLDIIAIVSLNNDNVIRITSEGYPSDIVDLSDLSVKTEEYGSSSSLIKGIVSRFREKGVNIGGFNIYSTSDVLSGSGLSSSAAFETLIGTIIDSEYNNNNEGAVEIAKTGQYAENVYFGKKSGLMDQMVSSVGGFVFIDFKSTEEPYIKKLEYKFEDSGYALCITDTKGSHADLTDDYVSVPSEMNEIAKKFGKKYLRDVSEKDFIEKLPELISEYSHRCVLRAGHFFAENQHAIDEADALAENNFEKFLEIVRKSGNSSAKWLQNIYSCKNPSEQGVSVGLFASERILGNKGASRVHGGGFAGTIQAFVPLEMKAEYEKEMNRIFGEGSCHCLKVRLAGGIKIA